MQALFADLLRLRWSVASCAGLVLAGALLAWLARVQVQAVLREEAAVAGQRQEIQRKLSRATDEEQEIREKIARYLDITRRGLIGREERLAWVEEIARIKANRKLFDIEYEILPQKPVDPVLLPDGAAAGGYEFMASTMHLQMRLLHEEDLLGLVRDLGARSKALLHVRSCTVDRISATGGTERPDAAQLKADCIIEWITIRERK